MMLVAVAAMGLAACTPEENTVVAENETKTIKVISDITRTEFDDARTQLIWSDGDTIGVYTDEGDVNVQSTTYPEEFTINVDRDATEVYAYYPYYDGNKDKASNKMSVGIKGTIEQSKPGKITTLGAVPLIGVGTIVDDTVSITFESYACVLALNVYGGESTTEKVTSIKFTGDKKSSGFDYNFNIENCDASTYTPAYDYTLVKLTGDAQFTPNGAKPAVASEFANAVFMPVARQTYGAGSVFEVTTTEKTYTFTATSAINCDQGYATLNLNLAKADKPNVDEGDGEIKEGNYALVVNKDDNYYAMPGEDNTPNKKRLDMVTVNDININDSYVTSEETIIWNISKASNGNYYVTYNGMKLSAVEGKNEAIISDSNNTISFHKNDNGTYKLRSSVEDNDARVLALNLSGGTNGFAFYKETTVTGNNASSYPCDFYLVPVSFKATPSISVNVDYVELPASGGDGVISITSKYLTEDIQVTNDYEEWLEAYINEDGDLYYSASENTSTESDREATIQLYADNIEIEITFVQSKKNIVSDDTTLGASYSYNFDSSVFSSNSTKALGSLNWTLDGDGGYWGYDNNNGRGHQFGSGSKPYKYMNLSTSDYAGGVKTIKINTSGASSISGKCIVTVGGTQIGNTITLTTSATEYTLSSDEMLEGEIIISYSQTSSKAIYIKSIKIN